MTLHMEEEGKASLGFDWEETAREVIAACLEQEGCPYEAEVDLLLTNDQEIHKINLEYRGMDRPTDVLSFPLADYPAPGDFSLVEQRNMEYFNPETGELMLGDIILSKDHVLEQAEKYGHSILREFAFLITHSMFHLMGYDHRNSQEALEMEAKQNQVLDALRITR
ncbi:MAG: rRNA maturation RNase YbeY [Lachnospiraceae bacterium]|jgi:probable rRNA maturation factor|nr:rRNA maturation RNase YbeY [Lachnospiraceae bacterium]MCI8994521.1 rRNA maturation RNase YbeY [Lachnospiraceae bacterium]MCI9133851.1 rRNA maturation RNase YbeY [Lachnospiraceae bacterium]